MNRHYRTCNIALDSEKESEEEFEEELEEEGEDELVGPQNKCCILSAVILKLVTFLGASIIIFVLIKNL